MCTLAEERLEALLGDGPGYAPAGGDDEDLRYVAWPVGRGPVSGVGYHNISLLKLKLKLKLDSAKDYRRWAVRVGPGMDGKLGRAG